MNNNVYMHVALARGVLLFTRDRSRMASRSTSICRLCRTEASANHTAALFSNAAVKQDLATRISDLLNVAVAANDGLPQHVCDKCMRRVKMLERAAEDLVDFRSQVSENYKTLTLARGPLKRAKDAVVSPDTIKARPPTKKLLSQRQLDFGHSKHHNNIIICTNSKHHNVTCTNQAN